MADCDTLFHRALAEYYQAARAYQSLPPGTDDIVSDAALNAVLDKVEDVAAAPVAGLGDLANKVRAIMDDGDWSRHGALVLADIEMLGSVH